MRYFKSFFKHTWHPQQMDTAGRYNSARHCAARRIDETELGELGSIPVPIVTSTTTTTTTTTTGPPAAPGATNHGVACYDGACKSKLGSRAGQPVHRLESPWHHLKTIFLVSMIISFIVWLIAYILLAQYGVV